MSLAEGYLEEDLCHLDKLCQIPFGYQN